MNFTVYSTNQNTTFETKHLIDNVCIKCTKVIKAKRFESSIKANNVSLMKNDTTSNSVINEVQTEFSQKKKTDFSLG